MTFCSIWTTTAATAELEYIQWLNTSPQFYPNGKTDSTIDTSPQFFPNMKTKWLFIIWIFSWSAKFPASGKFSGPFLLSIFPNLFHYWY
jgi:hypothetical protein